MISENSAILPSECLTGIAEIDEQHQQIGSLLEDLCRIVIESHVENRIDNRINELLSDIVETTRYHFNTEQKLMQKYCYKGSQLHCDEHAELLKRAVSIKEYCEAGDMVLSYRILRSLIDEWFLKHILEMDKDLASYLRSKGAL